MTPLRDSTWYGALPLGWRSSRVKFVARIAGSKSATLSDAVGEEGDPVFVTPADLGDDRPRKRGSGYIPTTLASSFDLVPPNSVLVCSIASVGKVGFFVVPTVTNPQVRGLVPARHYSGRYLTFSVEAMSQEFDKYTTKSVVPFMNASAVGDLRIPVPPLEVQRAIADFLDRKTAAIDALIATKERLAEALRQKRQAVISRAVTRGLESEAPVRDSGEPWLGSVPRHWKVVRAKFHLKLVTSGSRNWGEYLSDDGPVFLQSGNLGEDLSLDMRELQRVQLPSRAEGVRTLVKRGDVLVCITGAYTGNVAVVQEELGEAYVNQHIALLRVEPVHVDPMFLGHYLASPFGAFQFAQAQYGGTKQGLGLDDVKNVVVPLPPLDEQRAITAALASTNAALGRAVRAVSENVDKLREYRQALITAAVTGQLGVAAEPLEAA